MYQIELIIYINYFILYNKIYNLIIIINYIISIK